MDLVAMVAATGGACTLLGTGFGVVAKAWVDNATGSRKLYADQLQVAMQQILTLNERIDKLSGQIHNQQMEILQLSVAKTKTETENLQFRRDIMDLQRQIRGLNQEPVVPDTHVQPEVTSA